MTNLIKIKGFVLKEHCRHRNGKKIGKPYYDVVCTTRGYGIVTMTKLLQYGFNTEGYARFYKKHEAEQLLTVLRLTGV